MRGDDVTAVCANYGCRCVLMRNGGCAACTHGSPAIQPMHARVASCAASAISKGRVRVLLERGEARSAFRAAFPEGRSFCVTAPARVGEYLRTEIYETPHEDDKFDIVLLDFRSSRYSSPSFGVEAREDLRRVWSYGLRKDRRTRVVAFTFAAHGSPRVEEVSRTQIDVSAAYGWATKCADTFMFVDNAQEAVLLIFAAREASIIQRAVSSVMGWAEDDGTRSKKRKR